MSRQNDEEEEHVEGVEPDINDTLRILIATDIHLGYGEKYPERQNDSFTTFDEILEIAKSQRVDCVLLGGDLFHENRPTRFAEHNCMKILKKHVFGDEPVTMELVSDPEINFSHCDEHHRNVNYMDPNLNIGLPVFSIHGNHDDPCGLGGFCSLDNLHTAGLINYFGRIDNLKEITVTPLLFKKGHSKLALYGMSSVKDERLHRLFRENRVKMLKPEEETEDWFNLLVLHQNRTKHASATNFIPEHFIDGMFDLVLWGHEHECRLTPEKRFFAENKELFITQPGSSVATSLCEAEAVEKKVGILTIHGKQFKMDEFPLKTVRPMIFKTISLIENGPDLSKSKTEKDIQLKIDTFLRDYVRTLLDQELPSKLTNHPLQPKKPLVRVRVEYIDEAHNLAVGRFGNHFYNEVANPAEILLFKRMVYKKGSKENMSSIDIDGMEELVPENIVTTTIEDLIEEYFVNNSKLDLLGAKGMSSAVKHFVEKGDKKAIGHMVEKQLEKVVKVMNDNEVEDLDGFNEMLKLMKDKKKPNEEEAEANEIMQEPRVDNNQMEVDEMIEDDMDFVPEPAPKRGRGRGQSTRARGGARGRGRGRAKATIVEESDDEENSPKVPAASTATRGRGRAAARATKKPLVSSTPNRNASSSITSFFTKTSQLSSITSNSQSKKRGGRSNINYGSSDTDE